MSETQADYRFAYHTGMFREGLEGIEEYARDGRLHTDFVGGLQRYLRHRIPTGSFLRCIMSNDLKGAVRHADPSRSLGDIRNILSLFECYFPSDSWGSPEAVAAWLKAGENADTQPNAGAEAPTKDTPFEATNTDPALTDDDWEKAKVHFDSVRQHYVDMEGMVGVNTSVALAHVFRPMLTRYEAGERSRSLYDDMMGVE